MRLKNSVYNTVFIFLQQIATAVYGLIVPALIIKTYGSSVNGAISSITQFLSYITLLEAGMGSVIGTALYKPLADGDIKRISGVVKATENFFRKLAKIFLLYLCTIAVVYPYFVKEQFSWFFTFSLVLIISVSTFAQYYFGITYQLLLQADQKRWIVALIQIGSTIATLFITIGCIQLGFGIRLLKLVVAVIYVLKPLILSGYVKKNYQLDNNAAPDNDALSQRWDGLAHHIAYIIHYNTDITVLTIFTNVLEVSVYSVYYNIVSNIYRLISSVTLGIQSSVGNMIAKGEKCLVERTLNEYETLNFMLINILYSCVLILIIPFIKLYTVGVQDVDYIRPYFAIWLVLSEAAYSLRSPYDMIIFGSGHFKQTKRGAYIEACLNIVISLLLVKKWGGVGVAVGTFSAMLFRATQYAIYLQNNIMYRSIKIYIKKLLINFGTGAVIVCVFWNFNINLNSYFQWFEYASGVFLVVVAVNLLLNFVFYRKEMIGIISHFYKVKKRNS